MPEWYEQECRPFQLKETDDGVYYQAVGKKCDFEDIWAGTIIKALNRIADDETEISNKVKGIRIRYGRIDGYWSIKDTSNIKKVDGLVQLPCSYDISDGFNNVMVTQSTQSYDSGLAKSIDSF